MTILIDDWVGQELSNSRYAVESLIGEGGMGKVYRATDRNLDTHVVIKTPNRHMLSEPGFADRFQREIRSLVKLTHPRIVRITDFGLHSDLPFAVMAYLAGGDLKERQTSPEGNRIAQPSDSLHDWLPGVAAALDFIHNQKIVHRDVKPANILFDEHGNAYLSDFGVAKVMATEGDAPGVFGPKRETTLTETGLMLGTPEYLAPEMILGNPFDGRADQYALVITVYQALCGHLPFDAPNAGALFVKHTVEIPRRLDELYTNVPKKLATVIAKGLEKKPDDRFPTCKVFSDALFEALQGHSFQIASTGGAPTAAISTLSSSAVPDTLRISKRAAVGMFGRAARWLQGTPGDSKSVLRRRRLSVLGVAALLIATATWKIFFRQNARQANDFNGNGFSARPPFQQPVVQDPVPQPPPPPTLTAEERELAIPLAAASSSGDFRNSLGMNMKCILPGRYRNSGNMWREVEKPFWISQSEVTVSQYLFFIQNPSTPGRTNDALLPIWLQPNSADFFQKPSSRYRDLGESLLWNSAPVIGVSPGGINAFCTWLADKDGRNQPTKLTYRLPTADEWLCAYRAGAETRYYWGKDLDRTKFNGAEQDSFAGLAPVGSFPPNSWGLVDMAGNAWEMIEQGGACGGGCDSRNEFEFSDLSARTVTTAGAVIGFRLVAVSER